MNLSDELKQMKRKGRQVVSIDFVLHALRSIESHDKTNLVDSLVDEDEERLKRINSLWGGDQNRNLSQADR